MMVSAVLYSVDEPRQRAFYQQVLGLSLVRTQHGHSVLATDGFELVLLAVPAAVAGSVTVTDPPRRRAETPIKLVFPVVDLPSVRTAAAALGGRLDPEDREWDYRGARVCDGHDPEGNVFQVRVSGRD